VAEIAAASAIPHAWLYPEIVIIVIVTTVIISAIGLPLFARKPPEDKDKSDLGEKGAASDSD